MKVGFGFIYNLTVNQVCGLKEVTKFPNAHTDTHTHLAKLTFS